VRFVNSSSCKSRISGLPCMLTWCVITVQVELSHALTILWVYCRDDCLVKDMVFGCGQVNYCGDYILFFQDALDVAS
jgi:hypothetical protein